MAGSPRNRRSRTTLLALLAVIVMLFGGIGAAHLWGTPKAQLTPLLGLDLAGGRQVVIEPIVEGGDTVQAEQLNQAIDIIRRRVDGQGVAEAEVSRLGSSIQVAIPGTPTASQLEALSRSSQLRFRAVLVSAPATAQQPTEPPRELPLPVGPTVEPSDSPTEEPSDPSADPAETTNAAYPEGLLADQQPVAAAVDPASALSGAVPASGSADDASSTEAPAPDDADDA